MDEVDSSAVVGVWLGVGATPRPLPSLRQANLEQHPSLTLLQMFVQSLFPTKLVLSIETNPWMLCYADDTTQRILPSHGLV